MKNLFVPYLISLELKKLGYNKKGFAWYINGDNLNTELLTRIYIDESDSCEAPTYKEATDWLDLTFRVRVYTKPTVGGNFTYGIYVWLGGALGWEKYTGIVEKSFNTDAEAIVYGIEQSLKMELKLLTN